MRRLALAAGLALAACATPPGPEAAASPEPEALERPTATERLAASVAGEELVRLQPLVGAWGVVAEEYRGDALRPLAEGRAEIGPALSGRFLEWRTKVVVDGQAVRSRGLLGFDRERELFELHWVSELSSAQRIARGRGRADRGGLTLESADLDPATGGVRRARTVLRLEGADAFTMRQETWDPDRSEWRGLVLTTYSRLSPGGGSTSAPPPR